MTQILEAERVTMEGVLQRPATAVAPGAGLLRKDQFQVAYVTNDLDRACKILSERYGIGDYAFIEGKMASGGDIRVAFAWVGPTMYEIIDARGPGTAFYNERLPTDGFAIRFHHLGFLIHDRANWQAVEREFRDSDWRIAFETFNNGFMDAIYVEAPELGHYLEYIYAYEAGLQFFHSVPVS
jgi:hypothetical protein